jgi:putative nucleotidyltransferase with HDIG domain
MNAESAAAVTAIAGTRRAVQLYPPAHPAYGEAVGDLEVAIRNACAVEPLVLNLHQGRLYHGSLPIPDDVPGLAQVTETFESLSIESLVFQSSFSASEAIGLTEVLSLKPSPDLDLSEEFASRGIVSVAASLLARTGDGEGGERDVVREQDRALFRRSVSSTRNMLEQVSAGDLTAVAGARSLAESLIPRLEQDSAAVQSMAAARRPKERQLYHSLNVMIYALLLGNRLGLPAEGLSSLGTAAVLHDIGKSAFDLNDPEQAERAQTEHPRVGAEMLQHLALDDVAPMLVAYEHHMYANGSGFPERAPGYVAHPYSRIVSIADRFVNLTNPAPGTPALTPDRALVQVLREANQFFDPFLARLFANMLGPFPVGCVVRLSDQSVGVVYRSGNNPLSPVVRLAYDSHGLEVTEDRDLDLTLSNVSIVEVVAPESLDVDVAELL